MIHRLYACLYNINILHIHVNLGLNVLGEFYVKKVDCISYKLLASTIHIRKNPLNGKIIDDQTYLK